MAIPASKHPDIEHDLDAMTLDMFGRKRTESILTDICVQCGKPATNFRDAKSTQEYTISGYCQQCQDDMFGE